MNFPSIPEPGSVPNLGTVVSEGDDYLTITCGFKITMFSGEKGTVLVNGREYCRLGEIKRLIVSGAGDNDFEPTHFDVVLVLSFWHTLRVASEELEADAKVLANQIATFLSAKATPTSTLVEEEKVDAKYFLWPL